MISLGLDTRNAAFTTAFFPIEQAAQAQPMTPMSDGCTACLGFGVTRHETRPFLVCFDGRVVRNAG